MTKAPVQAFADWISGLFAPFVLVAAVATAAAWLVASWAGGVPAAWIPVGQSPFVFSLLFGIAVVVIACPCALGLATPTAVMVGTGVGARMGVLIKASEEEEGAWKDVDSFIAQFFAPPPPPHVHSGRRRARSCPRRQRSGI